MIILSRLLEHNVQPVVILDGSYEENKRKTLWTRAREQLTKGLRCTPSSQRRCTVLPLFSKGRHFCLSPQLKKIMILIWVLDLFIDAIKDLEIKIIQTLGEADRYMAHYAARVLSCPVLSNDSDFLIFDGVDVIELKSINVFTSDGDDDEFGIRCRKFKRSAFLQAYGLKTSKLLPLAATLMGNDDTGGKSKITSVIDRIFAQVKQDKANKSVCQRHRRMAAILKWLGRQQGDNEDLGKALDRLLQPVPAGKEREDARDLVQEAANSYIFSADVETCHNETCNCIVWPFICKVEFIQKLYYEASYPSWFMNIIRHKHFFLTSQVEDATISSSVQLCRPILANISFILLSHIVDRGTVSMTARYSGKRLETRVLLKHEESPEDLKLSEDNLFQWSIRFWCQNSDVTSQELAAVILFYLTSNDVSGQMKQVFYSESSLKELRGVYDKLTVHSLANFQAVLYFATILQRLTSVGQEVAMGMMRNWSGVHQYNVIHRFESVDTLKLKIGEDIGNEAVEKFATLFDSTRESISKLRTNVGQDSRKKRQRSKKKSANANNSKDEDKEDNEIATTDEDSNVLDVDNRFRLLTLIT